MTEDQYDEFVAKLEAKYPDLFTKPYGGVCVGPGWWTIIETLCAHIDEHVKFKNEQRDRWNRGDGCEPVTIAQIKEKFGGLRFYYDGGDSVVAGMVYMAEAWAAHSCEVCGNMGKSRSGGWIRTLCDKHEKAWQEDKSRADVNQNPA